MKTVNFGVKSGGRLHVMQESVHDNSRYSESDAGNVGVRPALSAAGRGVWLAATSAAIGAVVIAAGLFLPATAALTGLAIAPKTCAGGKAHTRGTPSITAIMMDPTRATDCFRPIAQLTKTIQTTGEARRITLRP